MNIREQNKIRNDDYLKSIGPERIISNLIKGNVNTLSELVSTGKSGSFFYFTADGKYTIKTIKLKEFTVFRKFLKEYHTHLIDNPYSLINKLSFLHYLLIIHIFNRIYGLHKIKCRTGSKFSSKSIYFVVLENVLSTHQPIHEKYDLKGSLYKRTTHETYFFILNQPKKNQI